MSQDKEQPKPTMIAVNCLTCTEIEKVRYDAEPCRYCRMNYLKDIYYKKGKNAEGDPGCATCRWTTKNKTKKPCIDCKLNSTFEVKWINKRPDLKPDHDTVEMGVLAGVGHHRKN